MNNNKDNKTYTININKDKQRLVVFSGRRRGSLSETFPGTGCKALSLKGTTLVVVVVVVVAVVVAVVVVVMR